MIKSIICGVGIVGVIAACHGCATTSAVVSAVDVVAPVIEGALCTLATDQVAEPGWEKFLCTIAGDDSSVAADGGAAEPQGQASFIVKVPIAEAKSFAAAHTSAGQAAKK